MSRLRRAAASRNPSGEASPNVFLGSQIGRQSLLYVVGFLAGLPLFLINVVVLTHFLTPAQYGNLGVLFAVAAVLTMLENLVTMRGTLGWAYGAGAAEDDDEDIGGDDDEDQREIAARRDPRRAMGTGLAMTLIVVVALSVLPIAFASTLADWLIGDSEADGAIVWMVLGAGSVAVWRLVVVGVPRMERRPLLFGAMNLLYAALVVGSPSPGVAMDGDRGAPTASRQQAPR